MTAVQSRSMYKSIALEKLLPYYHKELLARINDYCCIIMKVVQKCINFLIECMRFFFKQQWRSSTGRRTIKVHQLFDKKPSNFSKTTKINKTQKRVSTFHSSIYAVFFKHLKGVVFDFFYQKNISPQKKTTKLKDRQDLSTSHFDDLGCFWTAPRPKERYFFFLTPLFDSLLPSLH